MRKPGIVLLLCGALALLACRSGADSDWAARELKPAKGAIAGLSFTISQPEGLAESEAQSGETSIVWEASTGKNSAPSFSVSKLSLPPATLKDAVARSGGGELTIVRQEAIEEGFLVTAESKDKGLVKADVYRSVGGEALWCSAMQVKEGGVSKPEEARAWLEKICLSMRSDGGGGLKRPPSPGLSPEMGDFIGNLGSSAKVAESLKKHAGPGLATKDMESYDLTEPKVTKAELHGANTCYTLEARAGATSRTYLVCWDGGKIVAIDDMGMK